MSTLDPHAAILTRSYRFRRVVATGGSGVVHSAIRLSDGLHVAMKVVRCESKDERRRWQREVGALARIDHPRVAELVDHGALPGALHGFVATRFVDGPTLESWLASRLFVDVDEVLRIVVSVLETLASVHDLGLVHRDVKATNVVLEPGTDHPTPVLVDFGIAHALDVDGTAWSRLTRPGSVIGTPEYVAPERIKGAVGDTRSDLWSVGVLLYRALLGRPPFRGANASQTLLRIVSEPLSPPWRRTDDVSRPMQALFEVIARALAKEPEARFRDARAMIEALARVGSVGDATRLGAAHARSDEEITAPCRPGL